jgi:hypothetical protein
MLNIETATLHKILYVGCVKRRHFSPRVN